jgi:uncharacterized protein YciU (UPF0263 family)
MLVILVNRMVDKESFQELYTYLADPKMDLLRDEFVVLLCRERGEKIVS